MHFAAYRLIDCKFSHLDTAKISLLFGSRLLKQQTLIEGFVAKNSQLKSINLLLFSWECVELFSKYLHNLENLTINLHDFGHNTIRFENVKNVFIGGSCGEYATKFSFPRLESIRLIYSTDLLSVWQNFFDNHKTVKRISLVEEFDIGCNDLPLLTRNLSSLADVEMRCATLIQMQQMNVFFQNHPKLTKISFRELEHHGGRESEIQNFKEIFGMEWHITEQVNGLVFERKYSTILE